MSASSADKLDIRRGTVTDTDRILELVKVSLGDEVPQDHAYWYWKHHDNPFGVSPVLLAEAAGQLVGLRVFMRWQWRAQNQTFHAVRAVDTATHPDWQRKGIFSKLTLKLVDEVREEGAAFVFNTPNDQSRPGYLKMGWSAVGRTDVWIRPLRPFSVVRALVTRKLRDTSNGTVPPQHAQRFTTADAFCSGSELPALLTSRNAESPDSRLTTPRTLDYLRWRYAAIPTFQYYALHAADVAGQAALLFRYKQNGPLLEVRICEMLVGSGPVSEKIAGSLLRRLARDSGADYASAMDNANNRERRALLLAGFVPAPRLGPVLTVRPLGSNDTAAMQRSNWRLSIGDLELF
jgi:GNAT superfamily N-acetyltransferase